MAASFEQQFPEQLQTWVDAMRAGYSALQALNYIAEESPEPTATLLKEVVKEVHEGVSIYDALKHLLVRTDTDDLDLVAAALAVQMETGGSLADKLELVSRIMTKRQETVVQH